LVLKRNVFGIDTLVLGVQSFFRLEANELRDDLYIPALSLVLLNRSDVINRSLDIEQFDVFYEFTRFQLGVP
tara:strand:+ start:100 stop:315 length:216 start_codon:yes stop_codon:yes gene_type:complete